MTVLNKAYLNKLEWVRLRIDRMWDSKWMPAAEVLEKKQDLTNREQKKVDKHINYVIFVVANWTNQNWWLFCGFVIFAWCLAHVSSKQNMSRSLMFILDNCICTGRDNFALYNNYGWICWWSVITKKMCQRLLKTYVILHKCGCTIYYM